jgi:hypothetical protein
MSRSDWFSSRRSLVARPPRGNKKLASTSRKLKRRAFEPLEERMVLSANVITDRLDYQPGDTAQIIASGYQPGEAVQFQVLHNDGTPNTGNGHLPWTVVDGSNNDLDGKVDGNIRTTWYVDSDDSAGSSFDLTAQGQATGLSSFTTFTDGNPAISIEQWKSLSQVWANGQANSGQAKYLEGDVVPYWLEANNLTVGTTYGVRINLDYYQSSTDAGGFLYLDTYNDTVSPTQNTGDGTGGPLPALSADNTYTFTDALYANPGLTFYVYNADVVSVSYSTSANGLTRFADIRFTPIAANENDGEATVNIYWGQRLSLPNEVITSANPDANSKGASGFTGGSLQTKIQGSGAAGTTWITPSNTVQLMTGTVVQGAISGYKWNDLDGDGVKDANEPGLAGWTIQLYKDDGDGVFDGGDALQTTKVTADGTTDANGDGSINALDLGFYKFAPLLRGTYFVKEVQQAGWTQSAPANNLFGPLTISETSTSFTNQNFGNYQAAGVTGVKFNDLDADGVKDAGEPGLSGWQIQAYADSNGNSVLDQAEFNLGAVASTTTNASGAYSLSLNPGQYIIVEVAQNGWTQSFPSNAPSELAAGLNTGAITLGAQGYPITVTSGQSNSGRDFGNFQKGKIEGVKYTDITGNSFSADDTGLGGVTINLYQGSDASGPVFATTTTAADGSYSFENLSPGTYFVEETVPNGYVQTGGNAGYVVVVTSGSNSSGNDFDNFQKGKITGTKYTDITGNSFSADDIGLGGVTINLYQGTDASGPVFATTTTAADGTYSFENLAPGTYFVQETVPAGYVQTGGNAGHVVTIGGTGVPSGGTSSNNNFDNFQKGSISGTKYTDITGNSFSADDTPLGGVTISLYQGTDATGTFITSTTTAADGTYSFGNLGPGTYFVQETVPSGYTQTGGNAGYIIVAASGFNSIGKDFDNAKNGSISGYKWNDLNADTVWDANEPGLGGFTIELYKNDGDGDVDGVAVSSDGTTDANGDGSIDALDLGYFQFTGLTPGEYFVIESYTTRPPGWTQTFPPANLWGPLVITANTPNYTGINIGNFQNAKITGVKYTDKTGNGVSADDTPLGGVTINLYQGADSSGTFITSTTTAADGSYSFDNLAPGTYFVQEAVPNGYVQTGGNAGYVVTIGGGGVTSGGTSSGNNFANFEKATITGVKYTDLTGNSFSADDTPLGGVTVNLYQGTDASGTFITSTTTAADGSYSFSNLSPGTYFVQETVPSGYVQTGGDAGYVVTVGGNGIGSGGTAADNDFDNFKTGRITGKKFTDITGNSFSADDTVLGDVTINLYRGTDASGTFITSTTTAADGSYVFENLGPGTYFVQETVPTGYIQTGGNAGYVIVASSGFDSKCNDFDNFKKGKISGTKYRDITGNSFSADDQPLGGVTINLYQGSDASGTLLATTTTAANGTYSFDNLGPGTYFVQEVVPNGYVQTGGNAGYVVQATSGFNSARNDFDNKHRDIIVIGPDKGNKSVPIVKIVDKDSGDILKQFYVYEASFLGGVRVATGDLNNDGVDEIIVAPGQGRAPEVRVFSQQGNLLDSFVAYASSYQGGVEIAVGDVDGDGWADIVTAPSHGRTEIRVFENQLTSSASPWSTAFTNTPDRKFNVFSSSFLGGATVAVADVGRFNNGVTQSATTPDGKGEIIVGNGPGMRSTIFVYDVSVTPKVVDTILPFSNSFKGGISLSTARVNSDAIPDFIVAAGNQGGSAVEVWSGRTDDNPDVRLAAFTAFGNTASKNAPVHATTLDTDGDGDADIIAAVQGTNGASNQIRFFSTSGAPLAPTLNGFIGPWNIASLKNADPNLPAHALAADQVFDSIGATVTTSVKKPKKK